MKSLDDHHPVAEEEKGASQQEEKRSDFCQLESFSTQIPAEKKTQNAHLFGSEQRRGHGKYFPLFERKKEEPVEDVREPGGDSGQLSEYNSN